MSAPGGVGGARAARARSTGSLQRQPGLPDVEDLAGWEVAIGSCSDPAELVRLAQHCPEATIVTAVCQAAGSDRYAQALRTALSRVPLPDSAQSAAMQMGALSQLFLAQNPRARGHHLKAMLEEALEGEVEQQALQHENMPVEVLIERLDAGDEMDAEWIMANPSCPLARIEDAAAAASVQSVRAEARYYLGRARLSAGALGGSDLSIEEKAALRAEADDCRSCAAERERGSVVAAEDHTEPCLQWHSLPEAWAPGLMAQVGARPPEAAERTMLITVVTATLKAEVVRRAQQAERSLVAVRGAVETWIDAGLDEMELASAIFDALEDPDSVFNETLLQWPHKVADMAEMGLGEELRQAAADWWREAGLGHPEALVELLAARARDAGAPAGVEVMEMGL